MLNITKAHIYTQREMDQKIPWYLGYAGSLPALGGRAQVFYVIPFNFLIIGWNRVLWRLQFGPLYAHRMEDEYSRGEKDGRACSKCCHTIDVADYPNDY